MRRWITTLVLFTVSCILFLEMLFRFVIPACELPAWMQLEGGFMVFDRGYQEQGYHATGRFPSVSSMHRWRINNDGWNSTFRYRRVAGRDRPLIALLGDSGVEGLWSDVEEHIDAWIHQELKGTFDVYAFGRHAQPLVEIMMLMERVDSIYKPDIFVVFLGHDALLSSLTRDAYGEYHYLFPAPLLGSFLVVAPDVREPSGLARAAMRSALVRFLAFQINLEIFPLTNVTLEYPDLSGWLRDSWMERLLPLAGRHMLARMSSTLGDRRLLIVGDSWIRRYSIYGEPSNAPSTETVDDGLALLDSLCSRKSTPGIDFLDLTDAYRAAWDSTGTCFESGTSRHLNGYGNSVAAHAIVRRLQHSGALRMAAASWRDRNPHPEQRLGR